MLDCGAADAAIGRVLMMLPAPTSVRAVLSRRGSVAPTTDLPNAASSRALCSAALVHMASMSVAAGFGLCGLCRRSNVCDGKPAVDALEVRCCRVAKRAAAAKRELLASVSCSCVGEQFARVDLDEVVSDGSLAWVR